MKCEFKCNSQDYFLLTTYYKKKRRYMKDFIKKSLDFCCENLTKEDILNLLCHQEIAWQSVKAEVNPICFYYNTKKFKVMKARFEEIFSCEIHNTAVIRYALVLYCKDIDRRKKILDKG